MRSYAIKRIRLNPNSQQLNKQITREIKLLSRLNHENVIRIYRSDSRHFSSLMPVYLIIEGREVLFNLGNLRVSHCFHANKKIQVEKN